MVPAGARGMRRAAGSPVVLLALGAAVVAGLGAAALRAAWLAAHVAVPSFVGLTVARAGEVALPLHLGIMVTSSWQDPHAAVGVVLAQDPSPGTLVFKGSVVGLTVSQGSGIVPELRGLPVAQAARRLEATGLRLGRVSYVSDPEAPAGTVVAQVPLPAAHLEANGPVDVHVSAGRRPIPDVPLPVPPPPAAPGVHAQ